MSQEWTLELTDGAKATLRRDPSRGSRALRLDYDFNGHTGYVLMRKKVRIELPDNYAFNFRIAGDSPANRLEMKLLSEDAQSVWWWWQQAFDFTKRWRKMRLKARHFSYGWGPKKEKLGVVGYMDFCVTATTGGAGTVWIDEPQLVEMPPDRLEPFTALQDWHGKDREVIVALGGNREFGGATIEWSDAALPRSFDLSVRAEGERRWRPLHKTNHHRGNLSFVHAPECQAAELRLRMRPAKRNAAVGIKTLRLEALEFSKTKNDFFAAVAKRYPRGWWPRQCAKEMSFWAVVGAYGDTRKALINQEGVVEVDKTACSIEPFVLLRDVDATRGGAGATPIRPRKMLTWAEGEHECSLEDGYLPLPKVVRKHGEDGLELQVKPWVSGEPGHTVLQIEYRLRNISGDARTGEVQLAVRPFQVNPPWHYINWPGGFTPIKSIEWKRDNASGFPTCIVNSEKQITLQHPNFTLGTSTFADGDIVQYLAEGTLPRHDAAMKRVVKEAEGFASAAATLPFELNAGEELTFVVSVPMHEGGRTGRYAPTQPYEDVVAFWREKLARVRISLPPSAKEIEETLKAQFGWILVNRRGSAIQPGSRCYDRSWARDGALTSSALLHFGFTEEVRDFIEWFAPHQFENGKIPCVVDHAGGDPLPEHDSPGEFLFLLAEYLRYTGDDEFVRGLMPRVFRTVEYIENLLKTNEAKEPHLAGILPPSVSHEGYFDKAAYSYWDDFWCLKGLDDAVWLEERLGNRGGSHVVGEAHLRATRDKFKAALYESIKAAMCHHKVEFVPGSADRGDFDATSTTIALDPANQLAEMRDEFHATFESYWREFLTRKTPQFNQHANVWSSYTPYEWRNVGAFIRLGMRGWAHDALDWFMQHRRPIGWRHWAEVVHNDPNTPISVGDMPHTWVGSDFVRSVCSFLAYERNDGAIVVGAGIKYCWMFEPGAMNFTVQTAHGSIAFSGKRSGYRYRIHLSGDCRAPVVLQMPFYAKGIRVDGRAAQLELPVTLPAEVVIDLD